MAIASVRAAIVLKRLRRWRDQRNSLASGKGLDDLTSATHGNSVGSNDYGFYAEDMGFDSAMDARQTIAEVAQGRS